MTVTVRLPGVLREFAGGRPTVAIAVPDGATVGDVLDRLAADLPALERRIRGERGVIRRHVNVFVGETNVRDAAGLATSAPDGAEVVVIPAVSGG